MKKKTIQECLVVQMIHSSRAKEEKLYQSFAPPGGQQGSTLSAMIAKYPSVIAALEKIQEDSQGDAASDAESYIRLLTESNFLVCLFVTHFILSYCAPVTTTLQAVNCDLGKAYRDITLSTEAISNAWSSETWDKLWTRTEILAKQIDVEIVKPRTTASQRHRGNAAAGDVRIILKQSPKDYYRINVYYTFIDHVVSQLEA